MGELQLRTVAIGCEGDDDGFVQGEPVGTPVDGVEASPKPLAPLPEPKGALVPLALGALAALPCAARVSPSCRVSRVAEG